MVELNNEIEATEAQLTNAVIATDASPNTLNLTTTDIQLAVQDQFGSQALPLSVTRFGSDFVIQFATRHERDVVASSEILEGHGFSMLLVTWSNRYGGKTIKWETEVAIDINGFPPHAFHPSALGPLLSRHCSIQAYNFSKKRGTCRVKAYALSTRSIPTSGEFGFQYPDVHGVQNVVFPVTMTAYPHSEAPEFPEDDVPADPAETTDPAESIASFDTGC